MLKVVKQNHKCFKLLLKVAKDYSLLISCLPVFYYFDLFNIMTTSGDSNDIVRVSSSFCSVFAIFLRIKFDLKLIN